MSNYDHIDGMKNARKLFRLFKSANEYQKFMNLMEKGMKGDTTALVTMAARLFYFAYWIFDNL